MRADLRESGRERLIGARMLDGAPEAFVEYDRLHEACLSGTRFSVMVHLPIVRESLHRSLECRYDLRVARESLEEFSHYFRPGE